MNGSRARTKSNSSVILTDNNNDAATSHGLAPSTANLCMRALACQPCMALCSAPKAEPGTSSSAYRIGTARVRQRGGGS